MADDSVSATTVINAPAEAIFAVLSDPAKHPAIDGTGWVLRSVDSKPLTAAGQGFRDVHVPPEPPGRELRTATGSSVRSPRTISWETGYDPRRRYPSLRRLVLALRHSRRLPLEHHRHTHL